MLGHGGLRYGIGCGFGGFGRLILDLGGLILGSGVMGLWGVIFVFGTGQGGFTGCWDGFLGLMTCAGAGVVAF